MGIELLLLYIACIAAVANFFFSLFRTYYNWRTLKESRQYWGSWKKRRKDIAKDVLSSLSTRKLKAEIKKRKKKS